MKDKITFKKVILTIIGFLIFAFIIVPVGETLIYQSRYKSINNEMVEINNEDFYMKINQFVASGRDGLVNIDFIKKNDKWKYAEVQVIDKDGYIIHREYEDISNYDENLKYNLDFGYKGEDSAYLNIEGSNEIKEPATILNRIKNTIKNSPIYKEVEKIYDKYLKDVFKMNFSELKDLPLWLKTLYLQLTSSFFALDPGLRAILIIAISSMFI